MSFEDALCGSKATDMDPRSIQTDALADSTSPPKYVRYLRMAAWNAAFIIAGLLLIAVVGEVYLRLTNPFIDTSLPYQFVDGIGLMSEPNAELRYADWRDDNFVVSRANSQGFFDREPVSAERAAEGCHIAFIGDSYVEAKEVAIADKFHIRLEEMAARELPRLDITTRAYGIGNTGQIHQLPLYDEYVRRLVPKLLVLVFFLNDFADNSPTLYALSGGGGVDPDHLPYMSAQRDGRGALKLRPPDPEYERLRLPRLPKAWYISAWDRLAKVSYFAKWVDAKELWRHDRGPQFWAWSDMLAERPCCALLPDSSGSTERYSDLQFTEESLWPFLESALEYTAFGIDQFKRRADRDGVDLIIMAATGYMGMRGDPQFDRLSTIAEARGIPVISHYAYIVRQGHDEEDGLWHFDGHWNALGHQWAAEAILEWLKENQDVCE